VVEDNDTGPRDVDVAAGVDVCCPNETIGSCRPPDVVDVDVVVVSGVVVIVDVVVVEIEVGAGAVVVRVKETAGS
jgi:hypothetical protein